MALPSLTALRTFESAARHLSFRAAAEELAVTQSAVSHQVADLEKSLGVALFRREARRVALTEAGLLYYPFLRDAFERIAQGTALVTRTSAAGELNVTQTAVSRLVREVELWLGQNLFERRANTLAVTEAGRALAPRLGDAFRSLEAAVTSLQRRPGG